jgi:hypothetical protein
MVQTERKGQSRKDFDALVPDYVVAHPSIAPLLIRCGAPHVSEAMHQIPD